MKPRQPRYRLERLNSSHDTDSFTCGTRSGAADIDEYLKRRALAEQDAGLAAVWVASEQSAKIGEAMIGYFTLSPVMVRLSPTVQELLPVEVRYAQIGGYLLGRLGVATLYQGGDWGATLMAAAIAKANRLRDIGGGAFLAVDPKNETLTRWYDALGFGFVTLDPTGNSRRRILKLG